MSLETTVTVTPKELPNLIVDTIKAKLVPYISGSPGLGKALANSELVLTPNGFVPMGTLQVGDQVIGQDGKPATIKYVAPQGLRNIYKITFRDKTSINCDGEHLWEVAHYKKKDKWVTLTTTQLMQRKLSHYESDKRSKVGNTHRYHYRIKSIDPVEFAPQKKPELDPYVLGCLLGDGSLSSNNISFTNPNIQLFESIANKLPNEYQFSKIDFKNGAYTARIIRSDKSKPTFKNWLKTVMPEVLGKSTTRQIPKHYELGSIHTRSELIRGLNDTDGCWTNNKLVGIDLSNKALHDSYVFITRSLGNTVTTSQRVGKYDGNLCETSYRVFTVKNNKYHSIVSIEYSHQELATCISIDNESKLFVTNHFKPTHNSDIVRNVADKFNLQVIDIRLSQVDPTDLSGFPNIKDNRSEYFPPKDFPLEGDSLPENKNGWLIFFDEISSANPTTQAAAYKILLDRMIGQHKLHPNIAMVAAGNLSTDKAVVSRMSTAMQSRMIHFQLIANKENWIEWASSNDIDYRVTGFIDFRPDLLHKFDPNHNDLTFAAPRTWHFLSKLIKPKEKLTTEATPLIVGSVGVAAGFEFMAFCEEYDKIPNSKELVNNPESVKLYEEPSFYYAISSFIAHHIEPINASQLMKLITRLPLEFQVITLQNTVKKDETMLTIPEIKKWISENSNKLF